MRSNRFIKWENGIPKPADYDLMTKQQYENLTAVALSAPYDPIRDADGFVVRTEYEFRNDDGTWMTKAEVAKLRQAQKAAEGDGDALSRIEDRWLGKPKQSAEVFSVHASMEEWINAAMKAEQGFTVDGTITEVSILGIGTDLNDPEDTGVIISIPQLEPDMSWL